MSQIVHDRPEQLEMILSGLLEGEQAIAVYDCIGVGTGFVGLTTQRLILQDKSFVGNKIALTSLPYRNIQAVSMLTNRSMLGKFSSSSSISVSIGAKSFEADFRGDDKAKHAHDVILWHILNR